MVGGRLETSGYYALGVPLYFALCLLEGSVVRWRTGRSPYSTARTIGTLSGGLGEITLGLFLGPWLLSLYDWALEHLALMRLEPGAPLTWVVAFLLADLCYWIYHSTSHRFGVLWAIHQVHHQVDAFDITVALRHPWLADLYSAPFYAPLPLLGVPAFEFFVAISLISFYSLTIHSHVLARPNLWLLVTPRTHVVHHAWNRPYLAKNYGAMFTLWDRLFGTHVEPDEAIPLQLGVREGYSTHDGARSQWLGFARLFALARQAPSFREALRPFFGPPGTRPAGVPPLPAPPPARADADIPAAIKLWSAVQFALTSVLALWVLWLREEHPLWVHVAVATVVLASTSTIGQLLDGRPGALARDGARVVALVLLGAALTAGGYPVVGPCVVGVGLVSALAFGLLPGEPAPAPVPSARPLASVVS